MSYRFAIPGLLVVLSYGLLITAHRQLTQANDALEFEQRRRARILAESHRVDRDVAEALHRTVQGRLAAAVVMLRLGQRSDAWVQIVGMAKVEVPGLLERLSDAVPGGRLMIEAPIGLSIVQVGDLDVDAAMRADLQRALGEIAVNAHRHGGASMLVVYVSREGGRFVLICEDDGEGPAEMSAPGLGSRLLDDMAARYGGRWRMEPADPGCRVIVELPVPVSPRDLASSAV
jgi:two-component sensor histidine kinase